MKTKIKGKFVETNEEDALTMKKENKLLQAQLSESQVAIASLKENYQQEIKKTARLQARLNRAKERLDLWRHSAIKVEASLLKDDDE